MITLQWQQNVWLKKCKHAVNHKENAHSHLNTTWMLGVRGLECASLFTWVHWQLVRSQFTTHIKKNKEKKTKNDWHRQNLTNALSICGDVLDIVSFFMMFFKGLKLELPEYVYTHGRNHAVFGGFMSPPILRKWQSVPPIYSRKYVKYALFFKSCQQIPPPNCKLGCAHPRY